MAADVTKLNHEPMKVIFAGAEIGFVDAGEITVTYPHEWVDQMAHDTGNRVLERYYKPGNPTIHIKLLQAMDKSLWSIPFPFGSLQSSSGDSRFSEVLITAGSSTPHAGQKASSIDAELILRPARLYAAAATETVDDLVFPSAHVLSVGDFTYGIDAALALDLTFGTLYNPAATEGEHIAYFGKKTGTWVDA